MNRFSEKSPDFLDEIDETTRIHVSLTNASRGFDRPTTKLRLLFLKNSDTVTSACPQCVCFLFCVYRL